MAGSAGPTSHPLMDRLEAAPFEFDFFQAVRKLECLFAALPRVGQAYRPADEAVRFAQMPSLAFSPASIAAFRRRAELPPLMQVYFLGLLGPNGPLPLYLSALVRDRLRNHGDAAVSRFLDVFHHRVLGLFYRAWACNQQTVSHDRPGEDRFAVYIGSLFGIGMESLRDRDAVCDLAKLHYSGRLVSQTRCSEGLQQVLQDFFRVPAEVHEFVGQWLDLPEGYRCRLGESPSTGTLGMTAIVGSRFWECQQTFRIRMGAMGLADYERLLPSGNSLVRLVDWARNYCGDELQFHLQLVLKADEVPQIQLGQAGRLGWTTWLCSGPLGRDGDDLVLRPCRSASLSGA